MRFLLLATATSAVDVIVKLKAEAESADLQTFATSGTIFTASDEITHVYEHLPNFPAFAASVSEETFEALQADALNPNSMFAYVYEDELIQMTLDDWSDLEEGFSDDDIDTQRNAVWGLDRMDSRRLRLDGRYHYPESAGEGVTAYVLDTGIDVNHPEFEGRATNGFNVFPDEDFTDFHGHGTHVAGTVGGKTFGIAKEVNLVAVKVLNRSGFGTWGGVIAGMDWAVNDSAGKAAIANMSLGAQVVFQPINDALEAAVNAGLQFAVAAGNSNRPACEASPYSDNSLKIGATDNTDTRAWFSNWDECVDIFAPGVAVESAEANTGGSRESSGTSMAAPHVAGVAALMLGEARGLSPDQIHRLIVRWGTKGVVSDPNGSVNLLLHIPIDD